MHALMSVAPAVLEWRPVGQALQSSFVVNPIAALYVPTSQLRQFGGFEGSEEELP